jgi:hypothetical protein
MDDRQWTTDDGQSSIVHRHIEAFKCNLSKTVLTIYSIPPRD